jgi:alanine dehydrogenase
MRIGVPKEIKVHEYRVGLVPQGGARAGRGRARGHRQKATPAWASAAPMSDYRAAGAKHRASAAEVFAGAELIVKVKEPQPQECALLKPGQVLFTYLHLAADRRRPRRCSAPGATAIAYETVTAEDGSCRC